MPQRTFVMSDIHGYSDLFDHLLARLPIAWDTDELVILGDVLDRGPASAAVVARLMDLAAHYPQVTILRGNHEAMFLDALASEHAFAPWLAMGGDATYRAYCPPTRRMRWDILVRSVPPAVQQFLAHRPVWYTNAHGCYVHASATQTAPGSWDLSDPHTAVWGRDATFFRSYTGPLLVVGHTPTANIRAMLGEPPTTPVATAWERPQLIGLDCDVSGGGPLCVVALPERQYYYVFQPERPPGDHARCG